MLRYYGKRTFGNEDHYVSFYDIKKTLDNGYLLSGVTNKIGINYWDPLYVKLNPCGEIEWCTILNSELGGGSDYAVDAIQLADGSIIGQIKYYGYQIETIRISLVKMDKYGEPLWIKHLAQEDPSIYNEEGFELILTSDSNYLVTGNTGEPYLILSDPMGDEIWSHEWETEEGSGGMSGHSKEDRFGKFLYYF